jgi:hypothetical protein
MPAMTLDLPHIQGMADGSRIVRHVASLPPTGNVRVMSSVKGVSNRRFITTVGISSTSQDELESFTRGFVEHLVLREFCHFGVEGGY